MNGIQLLIIIFLTFQSAYAQSWEVKISGNIVNSDHSKLSDILVVILENTDTLKMGITDKKGKFELHTRFNAENDYTLRVNYKIHGNKSEDIRLFHKEDTAKISEYQLELVSPGIIVDKSDNSAYYALNETRVYENFEVKALQRFFDKFPGLCIEFVQTINPDEKEQVTRKRMKCFQDAIEKAGYDMSRISFRKEVLLLRNYELREDPRSRIQGIIISLDGDCKNK